MSVKQHEAEAGQHEQLATEHAAQYDPKATEWRERCGPVGRAGLSYSYGACWSSTVNPTQRHKDEADTHHKHAADHRAASAVLREAEASACSGIADGDRDMSPFMHTEDIVSVTPLTEGPSSGKQPSFAMAGAAVTFRAVPGMTAEWLQRLVDCHLARNAALGHVADDMPNCPLVPKGVTARVKSAGNGFLVEVRGENPAVTREILERANRLVGAPAPVSAR